MICPNCGRQTESDEKFCVGCGSPLTDSDNSKEEVKNEFQEENKVDEVNTENIETKNESEEQVDSEYTVDLSNNNIELNATDNVENQPVIANNDTVGVVEPSAKPKKSKKAFIIVAIVFALILIALLIVKFFVFTPKNLFFKGINEAYSNTIEKIEKNDKNDKTLSLKTNTTFDVKVNDKYVDDSTKQMLDFINNLKLEMNENIDSKTSNFDLNTILSNSSDKLELELYKREKAMYVGLGNLYSKYIKLDVSEVKDLDTESLNYVTKELKNIFLNSLDNSKFKQEKANITLQDKEMKVNKISYEFDKDEIKRILKEMKEKINNNQKLLDKMTSVTGKTKEELNQTFEDLLNEIESSYKEELANSKVVLAVYTKGLLNDVIGYSLTVKEDQNNIKLTYFYNKDVKEFKLIANSITFLTTTTKEISKNETETNITMFTATGKINTKTTDEKIVSTINVSELSSGMDLSGTIELPNKKDSATLNSFIKLNVSNEEVFNFNVKTTYEKSSDVILKEIDDKNSVSAYDLQQNDLENIMNKLTQNKFFAAMAISEINNATQSANARSVEAYMIAYETAYYQAILEDENVKFGDKLDVNYSGSNVACSNITSDEDGKITATCTVDGKTFTYDSNDGAKALN
jgi:hypothetical protein